MLTNMQIKMLHNAAQNNMLLNICKAAADFGDFDTLKYIAESQVLCSALPPAFAHALQLTVRDLDPYFNS
jgi:hypothetical protein